MNKTKTKIYIFLNKIFEFKQKCKSFLSFLLWQDEGFHSMQGQPWKEFNIKLFLLQYWVEIKNKVAENNAQSLYSTYTDELFWNDSWEHLMFY